MPSLSQPICAMANDPATTPLPGIAALPPTTARQIGSGQIIVDASCVVKELIDNALDARAKSIFVDIAASTIDSIQVKDDGHGIPAEDRALVCRRYCTSKIRNLDDLTNVGGRWLGFRGEALSSVAEMSGSLSVTTKVEGEPVAVKLKYGRDGELSSAERDSHPVGTTVKVAHLFENIPVRKQTAVKNASKCIARIRRLVQAYALARPAVRFRLHVLKAKNNKVDFIYAPKASANVEDAALKVVGKDCALQCDWTAIESDGFEIHAFLPKPTAKGPKIANHGAFISIDARPVSHSRGIAKQVVIAFKERLRRSNTSTVTVKDPFCCMDIICPPESYDANVEPAKDEVLFDNGEIVLEIVDKLLKSYYPGSIEVEDVEPPTSAQRPFLLESDALPDQDEASFTILQDTNESCGLPTSQRHSDPPRWRSSMYGIDEDDLEHLQENHHPEMFEEEGSRSATLSNPWTIARMNASIKPKGTPSHHQLLSPAKSQGEQQNESSSPRISASPDRPSSVKPLTPKSSSRMNGARAHVADDIEQSIRRRNQHSSDPSRPIRNSGLQTAARQREEMGQDSFSDPASIEGSRLQSDFRPLLPSVRPRSQRVQAPNAGKVTSAVVEGPKDTWFGQPMRGLGASQPSKHPKRRRGRGIPFLSDDSALSLQRPLVSSTERQTEDRLYPDHNKDIRDFFGQDLRRQTDKDKESTPGPSFNAINRPSQFKDHQRRLSSDGDGDGVAVPGLSQSEAQINTRSRHLERLSMPDLPHEQAGQELSSSQPLSPAHGSYELPIRSSRIRAAPRRSRERDTSSLYDGPINNARDMAAHFKLYEDRELDSPDTSASPIRRQAPRIAPEHETATKPLSQRRRTTEGAQRTKSSKLPLEHVPYASQIQNISLAVSLGVAVIVQKLSKVDMAHDSVEWGYPAETACDAFAEPVAERKVMTWVTKLDTTLHGLYGRKAGVDTCSLLHEAIQRGLTARKADDSIPALEAVEAQASQGDGELAQPSCSAVPVAFPGVLDLVPKTEDDFSDFDMSQFVDFDVEKSGYSDEADKGTVKKVEEEFGDGAEDDMLLDL
ncbi:hypothetical protein FB567DRAFT_527103 [Paraphoma chrysanthemicola]|uniref:DNA mismatch repair protein S5 domain-containing protein n=1 Tax=Paraphoma chrysanthemicola TaxID=798071 RepID=A0A8K0R4Z5_9PLEO|nr:hypothetical protein FB567DRAFT_527103 [Paraphoma chrysanthemicola]